MYSSPRKGKPFFRRCIRSRRASMRVLTASFPLSRASTTAKCLVPMASLRGGQDAYGRHVSPSDPSGSSVGQDACGLHLTLPDPHGKPHVELDLERGGSVVDAYLFPRR